MLRELVYLAGRVIETHEMGGNVCFRGLPGTGKTKGMVALCFDLVENHGYRWENVKGNLSIFADRGRGVYPDFKGSLPMPGYTRLTNLGIKHWIRKVYRKSRGKLTRQIIMVDEIDQVYSHKLGYNDEAIEDILTLWQDQKLENWFLYTKHIGRGCNILIRQATEISIKPFKDDVHDALYLRVIDGRVQQEKIKQIFNASRYNKNYWRWEPVY
jgi:hypothetical protein